MIRYNLVCDHAHEFESWFATSSSFEEQAQRGFVTCPVCSSAKVARAIMAPNVARTDLGEKPSAASASQEQAPAAGAAPGPALLIGEQEAALRSMVRELHRQVREKAEHVGERFAEEALKIHHGETDQRPIYGSASLEDARMLHDEGVEFMPLPRLPDSGH